MAKTKHRPKTKKKTPKIPYYRKPDNLTMEQWQSALRKQYAETQNFEILPVGDAEVFSDYKITNPESNQTYKVAIRGKESDWNFCSCLDFKTNQLGTCKHIEYVLLNLNKDTKKSKILKAGYQPHYTSVYLNYGSKREVKIRIGTEEKNAFKELAITFFDKHNVLKPGAYRVFDVFLQKAHALHPDFRCYPDAMDHILEKREAERRNQLIDNVLEDDDTFFKSVIKANLYPYQKEGVEFILRKGRCLIADDMGLGKTIQAIGAAEAMKKLFDISNVLIVCPTSLKYQWKSEIEKFTNSKSCAVEGKIFERKKQYTDNTFFYKICSYNVVGRDIEYINQSDFDLVILDEAQRIKNWKTKTAHSVKKVQSKYCIVLTGTPIENKLEELYSVVQMVNPLLLGALFRFISEHQITEEDTGKVIGYKDLDKIAGLLQDILLRRHKHDVLKQLPNRVDKNLFVPMTEKQLEYYGEAQDNVARLVNKWARHKFLNEKDRQKLLINLNLMRMACNSTFVIDQETRHDTKIDELMSILDEVFENGNEKVVVFSQWERMTRIVAKELDKRNIDYENLHGGVPSRKREELFNNFRNKPESRVFLSTDAGGVGLNLQSASLLVNLDLPWNPAVLEQRIARIHRMGQKRNVQIINLIAKGTIEEEMLTKLRFKSSLASGILDNGESSVFLGESKFNKLIKQVKELTENTGEPASVNHDDIEKEDKVGGVSNLQKEKTEEKSSNELLDKKQISLFGEGELEHVSNQKISSQTNQAKDLIESGSNFFGQLLHTLSDKNKTEKLIGTLVKKDEKTGDTYLKIPVKNKEVIENGLKMLGQLLENIGK